MAHEQVPEPPAVGGVSDARLAANRANAQHSTGPRTPEGKARSARNAMRHGIYGASVAVPRGPFAEDPDELCAQVRAIVAGLAPTDAIEQVHAERIANLYLRLARLAKVEAAAIAATSDYDTMDGERLDPAERDQRAGAAAVRMLRDALGYSSLIDTRLGRELERALRCYEALKGRDGVDADLGADLEFGGTNPTPSGQDSEDGNVDVPD